MARFESIEQLEAQEESLREEVQGLSDDMRKMYFQEQKRLLKDPDTYAALNWFFVGGIHHWYLGKYKTFAIEFGLLVTCVLLLFMGQTWAIVIMLAIAVYELPQLFYSQNISRKHNLLLSQDIYQRLKALDTSGVKQTR